MRLTHASARSRRPFAFPLLAGILAAALLVAAAGCGHKNSLAPALGAADLGSRTAASQALAGVPLHQTGVSETGALWVIDKPANWNGDLVLYTHGYLDPYQPLQLPNIDPIRAGLLERGYAVAASSYSANGYAVPEGMRDSHALGQMFTQVVAKPHRTILMGQSLGGIVGMLLAQKYPQTYEGGFFAAGVVGGTREEMQYVAEIRVLFDAVYPGVLPGDLEHMPPIPTQEELNRVVSGPVVAAVTANPNGLGIIQALARHPLPGRNSTELVTALAYVLGFASQGANDLLARSHGHHFFDNADYHYTSAALPQAVIDLVNARVARYSVPRDVNNEFLRWGVPGGPFAVPIVTLHNTYDPVVPFWHEGLLKDVAAGPNLTQNEKVAFGHTNFETAELLAGFDQLVTKLPAAQAVVAVE